MLDLLKKKNSQKGQALFEFIAFIPFLLMLYSVALTIANSLNGSINQQKATRGYFFYRLQNDSTFPTPERSGGDALNNFSEFSMSIIGWADKFEGQVPIAPCYKINLPIGDIQADKCDSTYTDDKTQFIRVGTVFGVCGASFIREGQHVSMAPFALTSNAGGPMIVTDIQRGCALTN
ncbi:MAG: hypothetical protein N4A33_09995 [Bacteriovoracaceae bacterium]|jgi:hypothetical protein|nr:hypothetical protein [Bacteriovoracaceae bacterium]